MKHVFLLLHCAIFAAATGAFSEEEDTGLTIRPRPPVPQAAPLDLPALTKKLRGTDMAAVRKAAAELAANRNPQAVQLLINLCMEGDAQRRMLGIRSLGRLNQPGAEDTLFKFALGDVYISLRLAAAEELARLETADKAAARFIDVLTNEKSPLRNFRYRALQALGRIGGKGAIECLTQNLNSTEVDMAGAAAEGLGSLRDPKVAKPLIDALGSANPDLKAAAADALEHLSGEKFRFDVVKWSQWQKENGAKIEPKKEAAPSDNSPGEEYSAKNPEADAVDIVIVFDTTGSMLHIWPQVSAAIDAVIASLIKNTPSMRLGTVKYRADDPARSLSYTIKTKPLTRKFDEVRDDMLDALFGGGSGGLQLGLDYAVRVMPWRIASRKIIILVGDTTPPEEGVRRCLRTISEGWQMDGILVDTLFVRTTHGSEHFDTYKLLGMSGHGRFYEYNKAEKHLVEMSAEKIDIKAGELPDETAKKLSTPRK